MLEDFTCSLQWWVNVDIVDSFYNYFQFNIQISIELYS